MANPALEANRGSEWRKWDLQIQPIKSEWFRNIEDKIEKIKNATRTYLEKAIEREISVVAVTDHNCGIAIDIALSLVKSEKLDVTILPGVEIDTSAGYQMLIIFNPEYKQKIGKQEWEGTVEHFLNQVCNLESPIIRSDGQAKSIDKDIHEILAKVCKEDIGLPIFAHSQSEKGLFNKTSRAERKKFFEKKFSGEYYFAIDHKTDEDILKTTNKIKGWDLDPNIFALIKSSDAHKASEVGNAVTWIKSEKTYEGLKQIVYDPQSRVAKQKEETIQPNNVIESITLDLPENSKINVGQGGDRNQENPFCFAGIRNTFYLSPFFNCFIGGRGSGKSTVLNFLGQYSRDPSSSENFWEKISPRFDIKDKNLFTFNGIEVFEYIGQSEVESFATNKKAFTEAIYKRADIRSGELLEKTEKDLSKILARISFFQSLIEEIKKLVEEKAEKEKGKKVLESSIKVTKSQEYAELATRITERSNQKQRLERGRVAVENLRNSIASLKEQFSNSNLKWDRASINDSSVSDSESEEESIDEQYKKAYRTAKKNIENTEEILREENFKDLLKKEEELTLDIKELENNLSNMLKEAGLSEENILQVKSAPQELVKINNELSRIENEIEGNEKRLNNYEMVFSEAKEVKKKYEKIIHNSIKPLAIILEDQAKENDNKDIKNIGLNYFFDDEQAWKEIAEEVHSYFSSHYSNSGRADSFKEYIFEKRENFSKNQTDILECLKNENSQAGYIRFLQNIFDEESNYQIFRTIRDKHLCNVARYKQIRVLYDKKDVEQASFGQKCTAVIVILLLFGNYPLIIDEPEAHLDSSLIANYLVALIKQTKKNRQIIFATHNANFVINGDAEKIFILKNETGTTEFIEATIEDLKNRDELLKLEGGKEAFKKRGEKLHI